MGGEHDTIRANRLSNREVLLTSTATHYPSAESNSGLLRPFKVSTEQEHLESNDEQTSSILGSDIDESDNDRTDDVSLSQYELDVVNRYLKDFCENEVIDSDAHDDHDQNVINNIDEQLAKALSIQIDCCDDGHTQLLTDIDHGSNISKSSNLLIDSQSDVSSSTSLLPVSDHADHTTDESRCSQTSRQIGFDQNNQSNTTATNTNYTNNAAQSVCADRILANNNDFNNNNIRLSNSDSDQSAVSIAFATNRNTSNNRFRENSQRPNPSSTTNPRLFGDNLPIIVGITSCVWGLFFYAVKSLYSDLT